jgi:spore coat polysaccharide biosynthesis predicted glycosyltransferase SpsG
MKVLLRSDASPSQGTGHVMRCLTLAEELIRRCHQVSLITNYSGVEWLEKVIENSQIEVIRTRQHELSLNDCLESSPDFVVVDSYQISAEEISLLAQSVPVLAIVDGDARGIIATEYLDHNLGAELEQWPDEVFGRLMAGSSFALIRDAVLEQKRESPWVFQGKLPHIVAVMGGSDPTGSIIRVSQALYYLRGKCSATIVVSKEWQGQVHKLLDGHEGFEIIEPTEKLPQVLASADIAISASGTSAWEICCLGIPSVLVAVVENQSESLQRMIERNLVMGIDLTRGGTIDVATEVETMVSKLMEDIDLREQLSKECVKFFDGSGKVRVVNVLEEIRKNAT